jgi:hypothetical protein
MGTNIFYQFGFLKFMTTILIIFLKILKIWKSVFIKIVFESHSASNKYKTTLINSQYFSFVEGGYSHSIES